MPRPRCGVRRCGDFPQAGSAREGPGGQLRPGAPRELGKRVLPGETPLVHPQGPRDPAVLRCDGKSEASRRRRRSARRGSWVPNASSPRPSSAARSRSPRASGVRRPRGGERPEPRSFPNSTRGRADSGPRGRHRPPGPGGLGPPLLCRGDSGRRLWRRASQARRRCSRSGEGGHTGRVHSGRNPPGRDGADAEPRRQAPEDTPAPHGMPWDRPG